MTDIQARFQLDYGNFNLAIDLHLPGTGITVVFGPSGCGKTTLLRCIAGLQKARQGFLSINGNVWQDDDHNIFVPTYKRSLGYVFQEANLFPHLTVAENLNFGLKRIKHLNTDTDKQHIIDLLAIGSLLHRKPERLSGGEKQRVAIARAVLLKPVILLMDEPLAALDFKHKQDILPFLKRLQQALNIPMLYVTHAQQELAQLADYLVFMANGKVSAAGEVTTLLSQIDIALAQDQQHIFSVWPSILIEQDVDYQLMTLAFAGGRLSLPSIPADIGTTLRIQIYARDVSIALQAPLASSILNTLPAHIIDITDYQNGQMLVRLQIDKSILLAQITRKSAALLNLQSGMTVYAQIKGVAVLT